MKKAIVIGASGFVGGYLIDLLQSQGVSVVATKLPTEKIASSCSVLDLDILDSLKIRDILSNLLPDTIFHLAAQSSVALSWKNPSLTLNINALGSLNVLQAVQDLGLHSKILLVGSGEEYGKAVESGLPVGENVAPEPMNVYSVSKVTQSMLGRVYSRISPSNIMMSRAFNHIGPKQSPQFVVSDFAKQIACIEAGMQKPIIRVGNLTAERDFSDVRDVVKAYVSIIQNGQNGEIYNVGSGQTVSIQHMLDLLLGMSTIEIETLVDETKVRPVETPCIVPSIAKIQGLGWAPSIPLEQSLFDTLQFWRKEFNVALVD